LLYYYWLAADRARWPENKAAQEETLVVIQSSRWCGKEISTLNIWIYLAEWRFFRGKGKNGNKEIEKSLLKDWQWTQ
jgi:hypothetical protein